MTTRTLSLIVIVTLLIAGVMHGQMAHRLKGIDDLRGIARIQ